MKPATILGASLAMAIASAGAAFSQDYSLPASYGDVTLTSGFTPDPYTANIVVRGELAASGVASGCAGWVARAPDLQLRYEASDYLPLIISATSNEDLTLLINDPNGHWHCDDDGGEGLNPLMRFSDPLSGVYDIWVGTYRQGARAQGTLSVSELTNAPRSSSLSSGPWEPDGGFASGPLRPEWAEAVPGENPLSTEGAAAALALIGRCYQAGMFAASDLNLAALSEDIRAGGNTMEDFSSGGEHYEIRLRFVEDLDEYGPDWLGFACFPVPYLLQ